jgi:uncharacterized membrane protein
MRPRTDAMLNGALIALGVMAILDNVLVHWILRLHRAVPGPHVLEIEIGLVALGVVLVGLGIWRERRARRVTGRGLPAS